MVEQGDKLGLGPLGESLVARVTAETEDNIRIISMRKANRHEQASSVKTSADPADDAPVRRADLAGRLALRQRAARGALLPNKQRVNLFLDDAVVQHFRALAGGRGYQTWINEALTQAMRAESIETVVRQTIREELRRS